MLSGSVGVAAPSIRSAQRSSVFHSVRRVNRGRTVQLPRLLSCQAYNVEIEHEGKVHTLSVPDGESILSVALDKGLDLPHDCKLGVCMTCPAKLISGSVANGTALLSADVAAAGYTLLCMAEPTSDCRIKTISEDELLDLQIGSG